MPNRIISIVKTGYKPYVVVDKINLVGLQYQHRKISGTLDSYMAYDGGLIFHMIWYPNKYIVQLVDGRCAMHGGMLVGNAESLKEHFDIEAVDVTLHDRETFQEQPGIVYRDHYDHMLSMTKRGDEDYGR